LCLITNSTDFFALRDDQFHSTSTEAPRSSRSNHGDYEQAYYAGVIWERLGNARIRHVILGPYSAYHALRMQ